MSEPQKPQWASDHKIDDTAFDNFNKEAEQLNCPPVAIAIERGFVNEIKYLEKEQKNSDLLIIQQDYFNADPPKDLFKGYDIKTFKKYGILPIAKWEEYTFFAKINSDKTEAEKDLVNPIYFLAPWNSMKKWFQYWEKNHVEVSQDEKKEALEGINTKVAEETLVKINFDEIKFPTRIEPPPIPTLVPPNVRLKTGDPFKYWVPLFDMAAYASITKDKVKFENWEGKWTTKEKFELSLTQPSIFKIVLDTQKPYHGYVMPSEINKEFFAKTLNGKYPEHVTIIPKIENQNITALYIGCCSKEKATKMNLIELENVISILPALKKAG